MSQLAHDLRVGWRSLLKDPGFAIVALLTIGIGIGANAAIFSYIDGAMLRPLPYPNGSRIVNLSQISPDHHKIRFSPADYLSVAAETKSFEAITAQLWNTAPFSNGEAEFELPNEKVGVQFFDVFRMRPQLGRVFLPGEDVPGKNHVAVISHLFWTNEFGGDPRILGRTFKLDGDLYMIIGVMPAGAFDRTATRVWRPLALGPDAMKRDERYLNCWASLKPGVAVETARAEAATLAGRFAHDFPAFDKDWGMRVERLSDILVSPDVRQSLLTLMGSVFLVLVIACANLANLTLARTNARSREVAIRSALGARRARLIRQFLTESVMLSVAGGVLGIGIAYVGMTGLRQIVPQQYLPANVYVAMDGRLLGFIAALAVLCGVAFGLFPALQASRADLSAALQQSSRGASAGRSSRVFRGALAVTEVALAFILLNGAGLLIHSFFNLQHVDVGFDAQEVMTGRLPLPANVLHSGDSLTNYLHQLRDRVAGIPGVTGAAVSSAVPLLDAGGYRMSFAVVGGTVDYTRLPDCTDEMVTPTYFSTMGLRLRRGRALNDHDNAAGAPVVVINETMARKYFPNTDPLNQRLMIPRMVFPPKGNMAMIDWQIVGVVADEKTSELNAVTEARPGVYMTLDQSPQPFQALLVRTTGDPNAYLRQIGAALQEVNPEQKVVYPMTLAEIKARSTGDQRLHSLLLSVFAGIAVALSVIGLYGVISYSVAQRTREIGIRSALGATRRDILWLVLRGALVLTAVGLALGYAGSLAAAKVVAALLFKVGSYDPVVVVLVTALLSTMMLIASLIPAQRAVRVSPVVALRQE